MSVAPSCCEVCDRNPTCGVDCGSCIDEMPYVCPGCHAVGGERCAPGCDEERMRREREDAYDVGPDEDLDVDRDDHDYPWRDVL